MNAKTIEVKIQVTNEEEIRQKLLDLVETLEKANSLIKELAGEPLKITLENQD